jgi:hypothetical protein
MNMGFARASLALGAMGRACGVMGYEVPSKNRIGCSKRLGGGVW